MLSARTGLTGAVAKVLGEAATMAIRDCSERTTLTHLEQRLMRPRETPLPFVPRPFVEEPLGGWLGRIAGFYRTDIDEL
jgi:hypothetical protein